jgi:dihydrofolate synthase/folylpolyglutamate synthase
MGDATEASVRTGLAQTDWPGRLERIPGRPPVILDGAHTPEGLRRLAADLRRLVGEARLVVVFAAMADKDLAEMIRAVRGLRPAGVVVTRASSAENRAAPADELAALWQVGHDGVSSAEVVEPAAAALARAQRLAGPEGVVLACGSLYLVGELRPALVADT